MSNLKSFIRKHNIKVDSVMVGENPHMIDQDWPAYHYKVTLKRDKTYFGTRERRQMTLFFSMGIGLDHEPETQDVLECLSSDCVSVENTQSFEDWASDLGYDMDSRKAYKTYKICQKQAERLECFLGKSLYNTLLWETEY